MILVHLILATKNIPVAYLKRATAVFLGTQWGKTYVHISSAKVQQIPYWPPLIRQEKERYICTTFFIVKRLKAYNPS